MPGAHFVPSCTSAAEEDETHTPMDEWPTSTSSRYDAPPGSEAKLQNIGFNVWLLSQNPAGCREVQHALDLACSADQRWTITRGLVGHVAKALMHPHATYALQKCIAANPPENSQFIIDEILERDGGLYHSARHRCGSRVVEHLWFFCPQNQVDAITEMLLLDAVALSRHPFGSHVMQRVFERGRPEHSYRLVRIIERHVALIASNPAGCRFIQSAVSCISNEDGKWLARAVLQAPDALQNIAALHDGRPALLVVLRSLGSVERENAMDTFGPHLREQLKEALVFQNSSS